MIKDSLKLSFMEQRKNQFLIFTISLLSIGFIQYLRKIANGYKLTQTGKILYLATMVIFTVTIMIVLYYSKLNNILAFCIGLAVVTLSEQIAKLFLILGNNFNQIIIKILKTFFNLDLSKTINKDINKSDAEIIQNQK